MKTNPTLRTTQDAPLLHIGAGSRAADDLERLINQALDGYAEEMAGMGNPDADFDLLKRLLEERKS